MTAKRVLWELRQSACSERAASAQAYLQAVPGGYGEGDRFLGCSVPDLRATAKKHSELPQEELQKLLDSQWHECRLTGLFILADQFQQAAKQRNPNRDAETREIVEFYLANLDAVNNWDLVDSSAPKILGVWLVENPTERGMLARLASSSVIWERRVAVLATFALIRNQEFNEVISLAEMLIDDEHDLIHKAVGWMLREVGNRDANELKSFLQKHAHHMPRTMLRYSIEKLSKEERSRWMAVSKQRTGSSPRA
ncbi:DNA alkylation repair enzyme [Neorhodopirellula lusitana]|uniref:DNA alkylation repair enzyme n=1 Tax=Neorhodopirellula lusitana TaxID=445327 RepID=A0ABY1Q4V3_9BACT|nr:DNA alkylation repair protein [Neorhodopirellula lusitana]SMP59508.1 DNA alkylation repair enzyme [Neorhodopirellula lusitana]